jgi:hypothetical protein
MTIRTFCRLTAIVSISSYGTLAIVPTRRDTGDLLPSQTRRFKPSCKRFPILGRWTCPRGATINLGRRRRPTRSRLRVSIAEEFTFHVSRFDHVGITVTDLDTATQFFVPSKQLATPCPKPELASQR